MFSKFGKVISKLWTNIRPVTLTEFLSLIMFFIHHPWTVFPPWNILVRRSSNIFNCYKLTSFRMFRELSNVTFSQRFQMDKMERCLTVFSTVRNNQEKKVLKHLKNFWTCRDHLEILFSLRYGNVNKKDPRIFVLAGCSSDQ